MLHRRHGAGCGEDVRSLARPRLHRHAAIHHRQHLAGSGDVVRRPEDLSVLGACGGEEHSGLHANEAGGLAAAASDHGSLPQSHDDPRSPVPRDVRGRPALQSGGRILRACQIQAALSQDHAHQCNAQELGQRHAADVFRQGRRYVRRFPDRLGLEFSEFSRHAVRDSRCRAPGVLLRQGVGSGLDLRQDRAHALSRLWPSDK